ncbi:MAG: hypothetical protein ABJN62_12625 [Halioglobus sp.]
MASVKRIAGRVLKVIVAVELAYLLIINVALQLSLTQNIVNMIRPEKFHVSWESAWSFYPFRVHAQGISANGQSRSQQWELNATSGAGSISLLPLIGKRVYVSGIRAENVDYRQRPRLKADKDYSKIQAHFPPITGRELVAADTSERKKKRPWKVYLSDMRASGQHSYWIFNLKGSGAGTAVVDMSIETRGGPFRLDAKDLHLKLDPAFVNSDIEIFKGGDLAGELGFSPFVPRENKGLRMLPFLYLDAQLDVAVRSLGFINLFTSNLGNLVISGAGQVKGRLAVSEGYMRAGTDFTAKTDDLGVTIREVAVVGRGVISIHTPADADLPLGMDISYDSLRVSRLGDTEPFLEGDSLDLEYRGSNFIAPDPDMSFKELLDDERAKERRKNSNFTLLIDDATVLDMSVLNDYLPPDMPLSFAGGSAVLDADVFLGVDDMSGSITLDSTDVAMKLDDQSFEADLAANINIAGGVPLEFKADISGSSVLLDKVSVDGEHESFEGDYWSALLELTEAEGVFNRPVTLSAKADLSVSDTRPLVAMFDNRGDPPGWVSKLMIVKDLKGKATLEMSEGRVTIPLAYVDSEIAEVAAKATFYQGERTGVVYARYKKLDLLIKRRNGKRNVDVIKVREKFDEYQLPSVK